MEASIAEVDRLLLQLEQNLESAKLSLRQQEDALGKVKILGRSLDTSGLLFSERGISILSTYALDQQISSQSREALRCLANAFLLHEPSRQTFVDLGYAPKAADRLKVDNPDDEFLISRILFLLTYNTKIDFPLLVTQHALADSINYHVLQHAAKFSKAGQRSLVNIPLQDMAMVETLKLMFNLTYFYPDMVSNFTSSVEPLINILLHHPLPSPPLQPPISYLLNALLNLDLKASETATSSERETRPSPLFPTSSRESVVDRLVCILDEATGKQDERELDQAAASLCTLLRRIYELATLQMKVHMRSLLLPSQEDRNKPLGQGKTLSSRLLRLSCSPNLPTLRENISGLLYELSDKNATKFVKNIGYGYASGFLMNHNIEVPASTIEVGSVDSDDAEGNADVNPVTGQHLDAEARDASESTEMTEEEKEREAERLFVLFERLKATGVVDVKNPVQQAVDEGRFEEID